ncbi:MAG: hypothetical protein OEW19_17895, partial [Acidobacteriota bacterium]|nr:hypothetical protein [Acidobacteriota bacterium]
MTGSGALAAAAGLLLLTMPVTAASRAAPPRTVARTILALYDSADEPTPRETAIHALAEMPLNHLGLVVRYHDIRTGLPPVRALDDVRGVITWFVGEAMPRPLAYLRWVEALAGGGRPLVVMGALGAMRDERGDLTPLEAVNRAVARLGWRYEGRWNATTAGASFAVADPRLTAFERPLPRLVPPYATVRATAPDARVALRAAVPGRPVADSDLIVLSPRGAFVAPGFAFFVDRADNREFRQWYVNPFELFREVYRTDGLPKPDTATLSGRRIYYSHIDGDGWRNLTQIEPYRTRYVIAARVVLDEIVRKFPDLPVTVGAVVGDLDPAWSGTEESLAAARDLYRLPHVEPAIHTYSHPLDWGFFATGQTLHDERGYAQRNVVVVGPDTVRSSGRVTPRSYDTRP